MWESSIDSNDLSYVSETLYRKKTGEYFLHCHGGPMSRYAVYQTYNTIISGDVIKPITPEEAREFAEKYLSADTYEAEFGIVDE
jgi:hypothetical protein